MRQNKVVVTVTGAAGQINYALLFRIASGAMFGPHTEIEFRLLELEAAMPALEGVAMELDDCAFPLLKKVTCTSDIATAMQGTNWALLVGAVPRKAGMERSDLLKINGGIFEAQGKAINDHAASDVRIFVVGNPCNTNALIAMHHAKDIPQDRFYAMTMLDENRARMQLAKKAGVDVTAVENLYIWGNHSATQYPDFYHATIHKKPVVETISDIAWLQQDFISTVQQRGAAVIKARGASSAASAANAIVDAVHDLVHETTGSGGYSMARVSQGEYGIDEGLIFSVPCRTTEKGECKVIPGISQNAFGQEKINRTLNELREEKQAVIDLGLI